MAMRDTPIQIRRIYPRIFQALIEYVLSDIAIFSLTRDVMLVTCCLRSVGIGATAGYGLEKTVSV